MGANASTSQSQRDITMAQIKANRQSRINAEDRRNYLADVVTWVDSRGQSRQLSTQYMINFENRRNYLAGGGTRVETNKSKCIF